MTGTHQRDALQELSRQVTTLVGKRYPEAIGVTETTFRRWMRPLREQIVGFQSGLMAGDVPFLLVVDRPEIKAGWSIAQTELNGKPGFTTMGDDELERFEPIDGIDPPSGNVYLAVGIESGNDLLNVAPEPSLGRIKRRRRSPLTLAEGLAFATHYPHLLRELNCIQMTGSRCGDKRVTGVWVSDKRPRLGWCFAGVRHSWLGAASCAGRVGATTDP